MSEKISVLIPIYEFGKIFYTTLDNEYESIKELSYIFY